MLHLSLRLTRLPNSVHALVAGQARHLCSTGSVDATSSPISHEKQSPMLQQLQSRIMLRGSPMSVAEYMQEVLTNPVAGYYMRKDVFGQAGDFVTSPEISQVFGEMIGIWMVSTWMQLGSPPKVQLLELGPGRGTLMADLLRSTAVFKGFREALSVHLVEVSPALRRLQWDKLRCRPAASHLPAGAGGPGAAASAGGGLASTSGAGLIGGSSSGGALGGGGSGGGLGVSGASSVLVGGADGGLLLPSGSGLLSPSGSGLLSSSGSSLLSQSGSGEEDGQLAGVSGLGDTPVRWHRDVGSVPEEACPVLVLAHEFIDALPVHQFVRDPSRGWVEKMVDVAGEGEGLRMVLSPGATPAAAVLVPRRLRGVDSPLKEELKALEVGAQGMAVAEVVAQRVGRQGGAALVIDYGKDGPYEDSLVAIRGHKGVEVLEDPGAADLSCWVDFAALRQAAQESGAPVAVHGPVSQRHLLLSLGLEARVNQLLTGGALTEEAGEKLMDAARRLVEGPPSGLGLSYQALAITSTNITAPPAAFEAPPQVPVDEAAPAAVEN